MLSPTSRMSACLLTAGQCGCWEEHGSWGPISLPFLAPETQVSLSLQALLVGSNAGASSAGSAGIRHVTSPHSAGHTASA